MFRVITSSLLTIALAFTLSCSSKDKKEKSGDGGDAAAIKTSDINFDPCGSDCGNLSGLSSINFELDKATLSAGSRKTLASNADWIKQNSGVTIQVEGHCDVRGSTEYNLALGERRAKAVKNYLVSLGIGGKQLQIISYGKEKLLDNGDSESSHSKNRRANFVPLPGN